ncbi:DUF1015 domain-containing protein [bacterium]|nr:DUF1015 domain-containing protein [bacterium]
MSTIRPFKGFRPKEGLEDKVASYPYDVINSAEARKIAEGNPHSFLHVVKPEIDLQEDIDLYSDEVYEKGAFNLHSFIENGTLKQDETPSLYIYSQKMGNIFQTGIVGLASAIEYDKGIIKKHEHTRPVKVKDRTKHVITQGAHAGPIFLTYRNNEEISAQVKEIQKGTPKYDITFDDGIQHILWVVQDTAIIEKIVKGFESVEYLYIADGHHRSESAAENYRRTQTPDTEGFLAVYFPDNELYIMDYNRAVKDLNGFDEEAFLQEVHKKFEIQASCSGCSGCGSQDKNPKERHAFGMYMNKQWYKLWIRNEFVKEDDPVKRLDSYILQNELLSPILAIDDPKTNERIAFIGGIRGMKELERIVDNEDFKVSFAMFPTSISELMDIADAGEVMPPKSTWFEPKLRSGFVVNVFKK